MELTLHKQIRENAPLRKSFDALAQKTFGISFEGWYRAGYWSDSYIPYVLAEGDTVLANASVNVMDFSWRGQSRRYIQIGTVMTEEAYRNRGLSRRLITEILADWKDRCDAAYLFANDSVIDFYPKFDFCKAQEYQYSMQLPSGTGSAKKLNMEKLENRELLRSHYELSNPFSALQMTKNYGLIAFYCLSILKDCVYYSAAHDAVVIAAQKGGVLDCYDVFGGDGFSFTEILLAVADTQPTVVRLGFTPSDTAGYTAAPYREEDTTLFVLSGKENIFTGSRVLFPLLSHA